MVQSDQGEAFEKILAVPFRGDLGVMEFIDQADSDNVQETLFYFMLCEVNLDPLHVYIHITSGLLGALLLGH